MCSKHFVPVAAALSFVQLSLTVWGPLAFPLESQITCNSMWYYIGLTALLALGTFVMLVTTMAVADRTACLERNAALYVFSTQAILAAWGVGIFAASSPECHRSFSIQIIIAYVYACILSIMLTVSSFVALLILMLEARTAKLKDAVIAYT
jgi:hypothetical protein